MAFFAEINITPSNSIQLSKIIKFVVTSEIVFLFSKTVFDFTVYNVIRLLFIKEFSSSASTL